MFIHSKGVVRLNAIVKYIVHLDSISLRSWNPGPQDGTWECRDRVRKVKIIGTSRVDYFTRKRVMYQHFVLLCPLDHFINVNTGWKKFLLLSVFFVMMMMRMIMMKAMGRIEITRKLRGYSSF